VSAMATYLPVEKLRAELQRFLSARRGNVVITFALATVPIVGFVGAAVDYSRANSAKAAMQAAVDSTALMLSKDAQSLTESQLTQKATSYFTALFNRTDVKNIQLTPVLTNPTQGSFRLDLAGKGTVDTTFTRVLGQQMVNINVTSEVLWGMKKLELALALDNTGSMAWSNKMTELKKAAKGLLDTLKKAASKPGDVKVAIIPFDTTVNIGTSYKDQPWFDIDSIDCNGWKWGSGCNSTNWKNYWEGCVRDRTYPYDAQDTTPSSGTAGTLFPVHDCGDLAKILPLTSDWTALNAKVDEMAPNGNTNVTIGLAWGWHALTSNAPLSEAAAPAPDLDKVLIILTDGTNTESWKNSNNTKVTSSSAIDERTALACANIKAANIKVYAVRVIDGNADLLKGCASNPSMYFDVQSASQLNSVFSAIAQNLANLRIAK
jgi:Flp pilus assembly protein TadG